MSNGADADRMQKWLGMVQTAIGVLLILAAPIWHLFITVHDLERENGRQAQVIQQIVSDQREFLRTEQGILVELAEIREAMKHLKEKP